MRFNRRYILILLVVLAIVVLFLPIRVRYNFLATAKISPLREWKLSRGVEEGFWSQSYDYQTDAVSDFMNYRFERGDIAELKIRDKLLTDTLVAAMDTVAFIESFYIDNEITRLDNLKEVEIANLSVVSTGQKQSLIDQAQKQYNYALQQYELEKKNFARQEVLFNDSVIPQADFDVAQNALALAEINTQVAYNALRSLETGDKDPVLDMTEQKIRSYTREIDRLKAQKELYTVVTPFGGWLSYDPELGGILKLNDISKLVLKIPVPYQQIPYLSNLHSVTFSTPDNKITITAAFKGYDETITLINNQQYVIAKAVTQEEVPGIFPGMVVKCRILCDKVTLLEYVVRNFSVAL
jgi:hypothetical protein